MVNEFLNYSYFGILNTDQKSDIIRKCTERAYLDLCRTIHFTTDDKNARYEYKAVVCDMFLNEYDVLENAVNYCSADNDKQNIFDREHKRICEEIYRKYSEISEFTYGQAQKWLNMTLKYVLMFEEDSVLKNYLHIPVDSYIMQSVGSDNPKLKYCLKLECVPKKNGTTGKYSKSSSKPWSKWNYEEYIDFQKHIRNAVSESDYSSPIEWENKAWIETAEYRK